MVDDILKKVCYSLISVGRRKLIFEQPMTLNHPYSHLQITCHMLRADNERRKIPNRGDNRHLRIFLAEFVFCTMK
jgi:hypothetical protein